MFCFVFLRQGLTLLPGVKCNGMIMAHCNLKLLGSSDSSTSASGVAEVTDMCHHTQLITFYVETEGGGRPCYIAQGGFELLGSSDPPALALQSGAITGVSHCAWPEIFYL